jgi:nucleoside 2-deoxyribosyltransferase
VPTAALASSDVLVEENVVQPGVVYRRDVTWIEESDVLVAEVSTPSHGVGYEIGYALGLRKPVICLYREGVQVSKMILGNPDPKLQIFSYLTLEDAVQSLRDRLNGVQL